MNAHLMSLGFCFPFLASVDLEVVLSPSKKSSLSCWPINKLEINEENSYQYSFTPSNKENQAVWATSRISWSLGHDKK